MIAVDIRQKIKRVVMSLKTMLSFISLLCICIFWMNSLQAGVVDLYFERGMEEGDQSCYLSRRGGQRVATGKQVEGANSYSCLIQINKHDFYGAAHFCAISGIEIIGIPRSPMCKFYSVGNSVEFVMKYTKNEGGGYLHCNINCLSKN